MKKNVQTNYLIKWIGSKRLLRQQISQLIPNDIDSYIEPFGGGAWVLFFKEKWANLEVYNDLDSRLVNLFSIVKYHPDELIKEFRFMLTSRRLFALIKDFKPITDIQRAARFLYILSRSFGAKMQHYGISKKCAPASSLNVITRIEAISQRLDKVQIENLNFKTLIPYYDHNKAFFYCDPPYTSGVGYETATAKDFAHEELCDILKNIKGRFLLSYNDSEKIRKLYKNFDIIKTSRRNGLNNIAVKNKMYNELLIKNY